jgi:hypothetical protein
MWESGTVCSWDRVTEECWLGGKEISFEAVIVGQLLDKDLTCHIFSAPDKHTLLWHISLVHCSLIAASCIIKSLAFGYCNKSMPISY